jgi:CrcB protein
MQTFESYLIVFLGAGLGGMLRHGINRVALAIGSTFPWNTLGINITGCIVMGMTAGWFAFKGETSQGMRLFLTTGILGGYTTFSAFSLDAALLWERGQERAAVAYVATSVIASLIGVFAGLSLMRR